MQENTCSERDLVTLARKFQFSFSRLSNASYQNRHTFYLENTNHSCEFWRKTIFQEQSNEFNI